jgi:hypothetical protein
MKTKTEIDTMTTTPLSPLDQRIDKAQVPGISAAFIISYD